MRSLVNDCGLNVDRTNQIGECALSIAAGRAVDRDRLAMVNMIMKDIEADVNQVTASGRTPLYIAAGKGNFDVVRCLVEQHGANVNKSDLRSVTPLKDIMMWFDTSSSTELT